MQKVVLMTSKQSILGHVTNQSPVTLMNIHLYTSWLVIHVSA